MSQETPQDGQMNIEIKEEVADGIYSNLAIVNHSPSEFVVDFVQMMPGMPKGRVRSRIILSPQHMKRLVRALQENIQRYEEAHGTIDEGTPPTMAMPFGGPTGQA
ncbi:MAG: DUF3467 domain-containing protein [Flavobacteriia bacterium]|jgi:hypothetical protein|nr:DUF3467 domain-containing protein [Flavobacteriia bacterium]